MEVFAKLFDDLCGEVMAFIGWLAWVFGWPVRCWRIHVEGR